MRTISQTSKFKKDYKREAKRHHQVILDADLFPVLRMLANDESLSKKYRDHSLSGEYVKHRECHLRPDLLLIYKKPDKTTLRLVRLGSHGELF